MTEQSAAQSQSAHLATNTGPRPIVMDDIYKLIGALHLEIEMLRRQNAHLREQLAAHGVTEE
jgi:hypothetical protein